MIDLSRAAWRKSSRSNNTGGACVEVASAPGVTAIRDSKNPDAGHLAFAPTVFATFLDAVKAGHLDG